ncbi:MAG: copper chaperone PCu(A)C [Dehalococcoidia bacterium]
MRAITIVFLLSVGVFLGACRAAAPTPTPKPSALLRVEDAWARPSPNMAGAVAAYFRIVNTGTVSDRLTGAEAPDVAGTVELHETAIEGGMARMHAMHAFEVPAGGTLELKPGGKHIMLLNLKRELKPGDRFTLTLKFEKAGTVQVAVEVRAP